MFKRERDLLEVHDCSKTCLQMTKHKAKSGVDGKGVKKEDAKAVTNAPGALQR